MTYSQTIYDNFDDNSIDSGLWTLGDNSGGWITETSGKMHFAPNDTTNYPNLASVLHPYDISVGIVAAKYYQNGTTDSNEIFMFGVHDGAGNIIMIQSYPSGGYVGFATSGSVSQSGATIVDTDGLRKTTWTNGNWIGMGNFGSDSVIYFYKSTDGQTWSEIGHATIGGTFNKSAAGHYTKYETYTSTWGYDLDDASYFGPAASNKYNVRVGGVWVPATPKVRVGGAWVPAHPKVRQGGSWVIPNPV